MSKLKSLKLKMFQAHKDSEIVFDPGFNVIVGPSDNGKSSIIRALEWIRTNRPRKIDNILNDNLQKSSTNEVSAILKTESFVIERKRTEKGTGSYILNNENSFSVLGSDVPQPITDALNMKDINIQSQLDGHFLILETPGKVASLINSVTKLDRIDESLGKLKSLKTKTKEEFDSLSGDLQEVNDFLDSGIKDTLHTLEKLEKNLNLRLIKRNNLSEKLSKTCLAIDKLFGVKNDIAAMGDISEAKKRIETLSFKIYQVRDVLIRKLNSVERVVRNLDVTSADLKGMVNITEVKGNIKDMPFRIEQRLKLSYRIQQVTFTIEKLSVTRYDMESPEKEKKQALYDRKEIELLLKDCPYCGSNLTKKAKDKLLGNK